MCNFLKILKLFETFKEKLTIAIDEDHRENISQ